MNKNTSGFTIVELLIVIVVIAILATISIVAYNGIQARARDNIRYADAKTIMKALELYKVDHGSYPPTSATSSGAGCTGNGYSFSWATDGTWMKPLVDGGYLAKVPTPPINDCTHYYRYLHPSATSYGCTSRTVSYYVLTIDGTDSTFIPADASNPSWNWKPCPEATAWWGTGASGWVFAKDDN
jgi:general secretion pathway protein G